ncbi:hypothetical protein [Reyranella sp.]|uniref:hypothetical protein n=1 Tax=Reyranella sp. TaxID=1929291 RepID=UPI0040352708
MRALIVATMLSTTACSMNPQYSAPWTVRAVEKAYEARDACLAKQAALHVESGMDVRSVERAVSSNCEAETSALIASSNPHNDATVTTAIRQDSDFRARGYVLKARGWHDDQEVLDPRED